MLRPKERLKTAILGGLSYTPLRYLVLPEERGTGGTNSSRYCYSVWMRHLVRMASHNLPTCYNCVAELGPGDSIGVGLTALLCGVQTYYAFDVVPHTSAALNLQILNGVAQLLRARAPIPDASEFPNLKPVLEDYSFPHHILPQERLEAGLHPDRLERIRSSIQNGGGMIHYHPHWHTKDQVTASSVDLVLSQAVLEHVAHPENVYRRMHQWLRPGGVMSHQVDFKCHGTSRVWNGHWTYSPIFWNFILRTRNRGYPLNRLPFSAHLQLMQGNGFTLVDSLTCNLPSTLEHRHLARAFRHLGNEDLTTSGAHFLAQKPVRAER